MSISPYSVQHDYEVQEYNQRRAAWKASEKKRKEEEKMLREQAKQARKAELKSLETRNNESKHKWHFGPIGKNRKSQRDMPPAVGKKEADYDTDSDEVTLTDALGA